MLKSYRFNENELITELLNQGKIILYPTDTIWGLGCRADLAHSIEQIYLIKKRPAQKSVILLVSDFNMLLDYVNYIPPKIENLILLSDSPVTVIYPDTKNLIPEAKAENGSVAIRICKDEFCQELIRSIGCPLVSTSANVSGQDSPKHFGQISSEIITQVDHIVKHRRDDLSESLPSAIIKFNQDGDLTVLR
ncbi:MAG TPA: L-threonylcarbamoyladenylate synthase [Saprospiraceae bacterium]|nr:L-threonylcarbamoyladenylate synthase [Saprospiraceae bacterium]